MCLYLQLQTCGDFPLNVEKKKVRFQMLTESKSKNRLIARWQWYLKYLFPKIFGDINFKILRIK